LAVGTRARAAAADKVVLGIIGTGGMGMNHVRTLSMRSDVEIAYVCDVDSERLAGAAEHVGSTLGSPPKAVKDLREVLDDQRIDAVFIATPDHWHARRRSSPLMRASTSTLKSPAVTTSAKAG
jgi:ornithine cyclodeaminase/alanine dehydrogenase-like protein (mu-crystallin family)